MSSSDQKLILGYWDIHGLGLPIRLFLELVGAQYEEEIYESAEKWFTKKKTIDLLFPNLPYLIDGDVKMTESLAILKYLGKKFDLEPKTENEIIVADQTGLLCFDIRISFYRLVYNVESYEKNKDQFIHMTASKLANLNNNLLAKNEYVVGTRLTYVDIVVYELLILMRAFHADLVNANADLVRFIERIDNLPNIKAYYTSNRWKKRTFCAFFSAFKGEK